MDSSVFKKVDAFFAAYPTRKVEKGQILIFANEPPEHIFYLIKGQVRQYSVSPHGEDVVVNIFKPPGFFPMSWAINKTPNNYIFEAASQIIYKQAQPDDVVTFLKTNPDVMYDLLGRVYKGTDGLLARMVHLMGGSARSRLLFELLLVQRRFGEERAKNTYFIAINETELASMAGLSRETVNRELRLLVKAGYAEVSRQGISLTNLTALEKEHSDSL